MNQQEVIDMAHESGAYHCFHTPSGWNDGDYIVSPEELQRFALLVAAKEREECAKVCDDMARIDTNDDKWTITRTMAFRETAEAIRSKVSTVPISKGKQRVRNEQLIKSFNSIEKFNKLIGNKHSYKSVLNQLQRVHEELNETLSAIDKKNNVELLDGVCDLLVVNLGLVAKMEALGYDVFSALNEVCENNLSKFTAEQALAQHTKNHYEGLHTPVEIVYDEEYNLYGVKRVEDLKLLKPLNYVGVDLSSFTPPPPPTGELQNGK